MLPKPKINFEPCEGEINYQSWERGCCLFTIYGYITNSQHGQLPLGLIAQLIEHCTGISQRSWVRIPFKPDVLFQALILKGSLHSSSNMWSFMQSFIVCKSDGGLKSPRVCVTTHCRYVCVVTLQKQVLTSFWQLSIGFHFMNQSYFKTFLQEGDVDMTTVKFPAAGVLYVNVTPASMVTVRHANFFVLLICKFLFYL